MNDRKWLAALLVCAALGCSTSRDRATQLQRVAKDWCLTIRASQVLPVYPLTEDLQVGDIFLVSTPIGEESKLFESKGFLPLDNVIARLYPSGYNDFYKGAYGVLDTSVVPHQWQFPVPAKAEAPFTDWGTAPGAAFPSYTFTVKKGAGASLALPINAVPVGLSLLHTANASGSVNISNAATYGLPVGQLDDQIEKWALANRGFLATYAPRISVDKRGRQQVDQSYIRVVQRVFVAGAVNVSLSSDRSFGGRLDAGAVTRQPLVPASGDGTQATSAASDYQQALAALNQSIASLNAGGSLQIASASANSIALNETFPRPLVIGFLAYDRAIGHNGVLGPAIPTQARVTGRKIIQPVGFAEDANTARLEAFLADPSNEKRFNDWLVQHGQNPANRGAIVNGDKYRELRQQIVDDLKVPEVN